MTGKVVAVAPGDSVRSAFFTMREHQLHHLPIVDSHRRILGVVSDRDLRRPDWVDEAPDISHYYQLDDETEVRDVMQTRVITVHTYEPVRHAVQLFLDHRFGSLPVVDKDGRLAGILTALDLLRTLGEMLDEAHRRGRD